MRIDQLYPLVPVSLGKNKNCKTCLVWQKWSCIPRQEIRVGLVRFVFNFITIQSQTSTPPHDSINYLDHLAWLVYYIVLLRQGVAMGLNLYLPPD